MFHSSPQLTWNTNRTDMPIKENQKVQRSAAGECLVFFVYRCEYDQRVRNAIIRFSGRLKSYGGEKLGISTCVRVLHAPEDSPWKCKRDWCVALLGFPNQKSARLWFISEPEIKQHDFPPPSDGFLIFSVRIRYPPVTGRMTFCWTELSCIRSKTLLQRDYVDKMSALMDKHNIDHGLVFINDKEADQLDRLRDCWLPYHAYYRLDVYDSEEQLQKFFNLEEAKALREVRNELCVTTQVAFTIDPRIC